MRSDGDIARYYDRNTLRFLLVGGGWGSDSIHRELWGPGVSTVQEASSYINILIADEIRGLGLWRPFSAIDMGCGIGGTMFELVDRFRDSHFVGITISQRQYDIAVGLCARKELQNRCTFVRGDFQTMRLGHDVDLIIAIESFVHSERPGSFIDVAAGHLRQGGTVIIVDDFLAEGGDVKSPAGRHISDFKAGWHAPSLCTIEDFAREAAACGLDLAKAADLTGLVRLGRLRDRVIERLSPVFRTLNLIDVPFFGNMIGGNALQRGLKEGFLGYHLLVLHKTA